MKKHCTALVTLFLVCVSSVAAQGDVVIPSPPVISSVFSVVENKEKINEKRVAQLQKRALRLIDERLRSLEANADAITKNKNLTDTQKNTLVSDIATTTVALTRLKEILPQKDATSTKALIESLYTDHRVYGIVIPKARLEVRLYQLTNHSQKLSDTFLKVQSNIDEHKAKGHDVALWQANLDKAKQTVAETMFKIDTLLVTTKTLTPSIYGTSSAMIIDTINKDIKNIRTSLNTVGSTVRKPVMFKKVVATSTQVTTSNR